MNMPQTEIFQNCPRFSKCNVNNCPLSSRYPKGFISQGDREQKCTLAKSICLRLGTNTDLKYRGLTVREFKGLNSWAMKTPEEQIKIKAKLRIHGFSTSVQNCKVVPIQKIDIDDNETQLGYIPCYQRLAPEVDSILTLDPTISSNAIAERLNIGKDTVLKAKKYIQDSRASSYQEKTPGLV